MAEALPVPIDKPLSRAYLREFSGWSTAYPPGASEPTSLNVMHNCSLNGEGDLSIRPGLRRVLNTPNPGPIVGDIEHFYTTDGRKAILYAIRDGGYVRFRTAVYNATTKVNAGIAYDSSWYKSDNQGSFAMPSSKAWRFGLGVQYALSPKSELGLATEYMRGGDMRDPSPLIGGKYENPYMVFLSAQYSYKF